MLQSSYQVATVGRYSLFVGLHRYVKSPSFYPPDDDMVRKRIETRISNSDLLDSSSVKARGIKSMKMHIMNPRHPQTKKELQESPRRRISSNEKTKLLEGARRAKAFDKWWILVRTKPKLLHLQVGNNLPASRYISKLLSWWQDFNGVNCIRNVDKSRCYLY
jgi:hypothetical protein